MPTPARAVSRLIHRLIKDSLFCAGAASLTIFAVILPAQTPVPALSNRRLEFEAASVRPAAPVVGEFSAGPYGGPGSADPTRIRGSNLTLRALLMRAFGLGYDQISGPEWIQSTRYDILATVRPGATNEQVNEMLSNLLVERFRLVFHHATQEMPLYELVDTRHVKLVPASGASGASSVVPPLDGNKGFPEIPAERTTGLWQMINPAGRIRVTARNQPVSALIRAIGNQAGRPVVDKTRLAGKYDFVLEYALVPGAIGMSGMPMPGLAPNLGAINNEAGDDPPPVLTTAIEEQLGLKLKTAKGPLEIFVIDHAEKIPIEN